MTSLDNKDYAGLPVGERSDRQEPNRRVPAMSNGGPGGDPSLAPAAPVVHRWRAFVLLAVAYFMTIVDLTIVNVALPTIGRKLQFPESDLQWVVTAYQWVVTAYGLTFGGFLLLGGRAADLLGRRRLFMIGMVTFTAASLACSLATTDTFLIVMRGFQGLGAAILLPAALSIVMNMFEERSERNKALGAWGALAATGATGSLGDVGENRRYPMARYQGEES